MHHQELNDRTVSALTDLANEVACAPTPRRTSYSSSIRELMALEKADVANQLKDQFPRGCRALYSISVDERIDRKELWGLFADAKKQKLEQRAYSRVLPFRNSKHLYVGSSKDLPKRVSEHLGFGARTTYSLHFCAWAESLDGIIIIEALLYDGLRQDVLCALEDQMSADLQPMFGRRGSL